MSNRRPVTTPMACGFCETSTPNAESWASKTPSSSAVDERDDSRLRFLNTHRNQIMNTITIILLVLSASITAAYAFAAPTSQPASQPATVRVKVFNGNGEL